MAIPDYQTLMLPLLKAVSDGQIHKIHSLYQKLSDEYQLTSEERAARVPSGRETTIKNRISWARTYLKKAGLIASPEKGMVQITNQGESVLKKKPKKIDNVFLREFDAFIEFRPRSGDKDKYGQQEDIEAEIQSTPEERLGSAYQLLRETLMTDLLEVVRNSSSDFFEQLVVDLMLAMGYGGNFEDAGRKTAKGSDNGIDGIINEDKLGLDSIYLQAKRWKDTVDRTEIDKFIGALTRQGARKGVFITTSGFSEGARAAAKGLPLSNIVLIDGKKLAQLMIDHNVGVSTKDIFEIKQIDSDYFSET